MKEKMMKQIYKMIVIFMVGFALVGCTNSKKSLPSFAGKPRVKINKNISIFDQQTPSSVIVDSGVQIVPVEEE